MDDSIPLMLLLFLSGFFSSAEIAFFTLSETKIHQLVQQGSKSARKIKELRSNPDNLLVTILIGNNIVNIALSAMATFWTTERFGSAGVGIATGIITIFILTFGEIIPKSLAANYAPKLAMLVAYPIYILSRVFSPVNWVFMKVMQLVNKVLRVPSNANQITKDDMHSLTHIGYERGVIKSHEKNFIDNVLKFNEKMVTEIMINTSEIEYIEGSVTLKKAMIVGLPKQYSRLPVKQSGEVVGFLFLRDILNHKRSDLDKLQVKDLARDIVKLPHDTKLHNAYKALLTTQTHMSLVIRDEEVVGMITLEDLIEEVLGEIHDETDEKHGRNFLLETLK